MILNCKNICKSYGTDVILENISFTINEHDKTAVVGINGAGKSTLFKILIGEEPADSGEIIWGKDTKIGYLAQHQDLHSENTIYDEVAARKADVINMEKRLRELEIAMKGAQGSALNSLLNEYNRLSTKFEAENGYACKSEITGVLKGLGFSEAEFTRKINTLSGGQKTKVALSSLLLSRPDIILLDEPTNHLDMNSIAWLEGFLMNYSGAVIIIAHDRYFLDRIVGKVLELENSHGTFFTGNYSDYASKKSRIRETQIQHYLNQQREIHHQEDVITKLRSFNREKSIKRAESHEKMLDRIERVDMPEELNSEMDIRLEPGIISGNDVLTLKGLKKGFGEKLLFKDANIALKRGERLAVIGNNGTGKTTLLKVINGIYEPDGGEIVIGAKVHIGYYDQEHQVLNMDKTIFDEIQDTYPHMDNTRVRNTLAAFLFTGDDVFKYIHDLSGGERGRVSLAKLMLSEANLLILDEPTNHLDMTSKEILEHALVSYTGTVLFVSHDRYFINRVATRIADLTNHTFVEYMGNYDYYLEKKNDVENRYFGTGAAIDSAIINALTGKSALNSAERLKKGSIPAGLNADSVNEKMNTFSSDNSSASAAQTLSAKEQWEADKLAAAKTRKIKAEIDRIENRISEIEKRDAEIDEMLIKPEVFSDPKKLMELNAEKKELASENDGLMEKWELLQS